ncbi:hypothetical protein [Actimicrobium antarcticum]|uniref:hypothetical protein n=1 Tax=Actimicrobium antarcticum TaxID=1051899 RepID=UPI0031D1B2F5
MKVSSLTPTFVLTAAIVTALLGGCDRRSADMPGAAPAPGMTGGAGANPSSSSMAPAPAPASSSLSTAPPPPETGAPATTGK